MPTIDEVISKRLDRLETIPSILSGKISSIQDDIFTELIAILNELEITDSKIVLNAKNLARVDSLMLKYEEALKGGQYGRIVNGFMAQLDEQKGLIDDQYRLDFGKAISTSSKLVFENSQKLTRRVLLADDFRTNFINVISDELTRNIEAGATFNELRLNLRDIVLGDEGRQPRMLGWVNQVSSDLFSTADRKYSYSIANDLGLSFGTYAGGLIKDSRPFCVARAGKYFHIEEVRSWAAEQWAGKFRNTTPQNIIYWLGGYNCQHTFVFRSLINVPMSDIERAIAAGFFVPTASEKELLNISS